MAGENFTAWDVAGLELTIGIGPGWDQVWGRGNGSGLGLELGLRPGYNWSELGLGYG